MAGTYAEILRHRLELPNAPQVPIVVLVLRHAAELPARAGVSRHRGLTETLMGRRLHLEVKLQFLVELSLEASTIEHRAQAKTNA